MPKGGLLLSGEKSFSVIPFMESSTHDRLRSTFNGARKEMKTDPAVGRRIGSQTRKRGHDRVNEGVR